MEDHMKLRAASMYGETGHNVRPSATRMNREERRRHQRDQAKLNKRILHANSKAK